jgi:hypothetical protein
MPAVKFFAIRGGPHPRLPHLKLKPSLLKILFVAYLLVRTTALASTYRKDMQSYAGVRADLIVQWQNAFYL